MNVELVRAAINGSTEEAAIQELAKLRAMYANSKPARTTKVGYWALANHRYWRLTGCKQFATKDEACLALFIIKSGAKLGHESLSALRGPSLTTLTEDLGQAQRKANGKHQCKTE